jgi:CubicO group peptidase (beta-lactamase class C family)
MTSFSWRPGLLLSLCALGAAMPAQAAPATAQPSGQVAALAPLEGLDAYIEKARADWGVPGTAVVIVKDDRIVYAKGFGVREAGRPDPVDADTVFAIGSASKAFTGAALGMLVDEKKIAWDGVVHDYMPAFELNDPYATRHATVRDLLAHRTGFISGSGWMWTGSGFDRDEIIRRLRFQTESHGFRNRFAYANEIYTAAGEIIPAVTGTSWDDFVAGRIFAPLGMTRSRTSVTALKGMRNVASPHGLIDGRIVTFPYRQVDNVGGAGAINASARDVAQWVRLQLGDGVFEGKRLISSAALAETHRAQIVPRGGGLTNPGGQFGEYGFGWILGDYRGKKVVQHSGGVDGMLCIVAMIPEEKLGVVVLSNMLPHQLTTAVQLKIFDAFLGGPGTDWNATLKAQDEKTKAEMEKRRAAQAAAAPGGAPMLPLDRYAGRYASDQYGEIEVAVEKGALTLTRPTAAAVLTPDGANRFKARWTSASILSVFGETAVGFTIGPAGDVAALELGSDRFARAQPPAAGQGSN